MNKSNGCGKFAEVVAKDMIKYAIIQRSQNSNTDKSERVIGGLNKYEMFERRYAVMQAFHYLMKNTPGLTKDVIDMTGLIFFVCNNVIKYNKRF